MQIEIAQIYSISKFLFGKENNCYLYFYQLRVLECRLYLENAQVRHGVKSVGFVTDK